MTLTAFVLIFFSVFLHAAWNTISKSVKPSMAFYLIMTVTAMLIWLPFLIFGKWNPFDMPPRFWLLILFSSIGEVLYMLGLAHAYSRSDISLVYPVARALPVLMVPAVTLLLGLGSKTPAWNAYLGMLVITVGCLVMPLKKFSDFSLKPYCNAVIGFIVLAAVGTTTYTIIDSISVGMVQEQMGRKNMLDIFSLMFFVEGGLSLGELLVVAFDRKERRLLKTLLFHSLSPELAGICSSCAYALVLLAMGYVSNVSYLQAFRQMSLPVGFFAGLLILKEKGTAPKYVGMFLIFAGLVSVALG